MENKLTNWIMEILIEKYLVQADKVCPSSVYDDLGLDSLALLEIAAIVKKEFNVSFPLGVIASEISIKESASRVLWSAA